MKVTKSEATSTTELVEEDVYTPKGKLTFNMAAETQEGEGGGLAVYRPPLSSDITVAAGQSVRKP